VLIPLTAVDHLIDGWSRQTFGVATGLLLTGGLVGLVYAYCVRFLSIAIQSVEGALAKVTMSMDDAARSLGESPRGVLWRVHRPLVSGGVLTAALIVFVDVMKELPATLIVRPLNLDTLAVQVFNLVADERLAEAAPAALSIVAAGLIPVLILSRLIAASRPGE
jgi:iron(III) transport system permease protein